MRSCLHGGWIKKQTQGYLKTKTNRFTVSECSITFLVDIKTNWSTNLFIWSARILSSLFLTSWGHNCIFFLYFISLQPWPMSWAHWESKHCLLNTKIPSPHSTTVNLNILHQNDLSSIFILKTALVHKNSIPFNINSI